MTESEKARPSWRERFRAKRRQRRETAVDRAKARRDHGVAGNALDDLARRNPDQMGGGGGG
jgi:hypothetical protein